MGFELVYGTAPPVGAGNYVQLRVNDLGPKNAAPLDKPKETTGTTITLQRARLKGRQCNVNIKQYGYHDMTCYLMALAFGAPTVTLISGTANKHVFKAGGSSLLSATIRWKQVSGAGILWFQATGLKIKTVKCTVQANGMLLWEFDGIAKYATYLASPPTPVSDSTSATYIQPIDMSQQALFTGTYPPGTAWVDPATKFDITVDNGLTPDWVIAATRDFNRLKLGLTTATASVSAFLDVYTGSMTDKEDNSASVYPNITLAAIDTVTTIGTTDHPSTIISVPRPYIDSVTQDNTDFDTMETGTMDFGYDSTLASNISFEFHNDLTSSIYTGH